jgi:hypothetical protein
MPKKITGEKEVKKKVEKETEKVKPIRVRLSADNQHYLIQGRRYPRMTKVIAVLDPEFQRVLAAIPDKMAEYAAYGTAVHKITELDDRNQHKKVDAFLREHSDKYPSLALNLAAWRCWVEATVKEFIAVEEYVWSDKLNCAGTVDRVAILKGDHRPSILDIKTSSTVTDTAFVQMAGYKRLYNEKAVGRAKAVRTVAVWMPRPSPGDLTVKERTGKKWEEKFLRAVKEFKQQTGEC